MNESEGKGMGDADEDQEEEEDSPHPPGGGESIARGWGSTGNTFSAVQKTDTRPWILTRP